MPARPSQRLLSLARMLPLASLLLAGGAAAQPTSQNDLQGDIAVRPNIYYSVPFGGPVTLSGDQLSWVVPDSLLPTTISNWASGTLDEFGAVIDVVPDAGIVIGTGATVGDPPDPMLPGVQDGEGAAVLESGSDNELQFLLREHSDPGPTGTHIFFSFNSPAPGSPFERNAILFPLTPSANFWGQFVSAGSLAFPYTTSNYYDILYAEVDVQPTQLVARIELATAPPLNPPETQLPIPYGPAYRITLDVDGDANTGDAVGYDRIYTAYHSGASTILPTARVFNGSYFELETVNLPTVSLVDNVVTITIPRSPFTLDELFRWTAAIDLSVTNPGGSLDDVWFNTVDATFPTGPEVFSSGFETLDGWTFFP